MTYRLEPSLIGLVVVLLCAAEVPAWADPTDGDEGPTPRAGEQVRPGMGGLPPTPGREESEAPRVEGAEGEDEDDDEPQYRFDFHGFLRIPAQLGLDKGRMHSPPHTPDFNYTDWTYTNNMGGPWTEMWFAYGDKTVSANVVLAAYNITEAGYKNLQAQLGIAQSFVTLNLPTLLGDNGGLRARVGAFVDRYGTAGRYDAGWYDTYLFGSTHTAGETIALDYRLGDRLVGSFEHGVGAKLEVAPLVTGLPDDVPYLPYPGDVQQGSTFLHHAHLSFTLDAKLTLVLHHMVAFTKDTEDEANAPDGSIQTMGVELKLWESQFGEGYLGWAHLIANNPLRVAGALETIHSFEGWNLRDNYFGEDATGTGSIDTILFQYTFSLARYFWYPQEWYGQANDLQLSVFGMYNRVASDDPGFSGQGLTGKQKLKLGGAVTYNAKSWLAFQGRYDLVQPNMADNTQSFHVISPAIIFSSRYASNEQIILSYSHYLVGDSVRGGYPYQASPPDQDALRIAAVMWW